MIPKRIVAGLLCTGVVRFGFDTIFPFAPLDGLIFPFTALVYPLPALAVRLNLRKPPVMLIVYREDLVFLLLCYGFVVFHNFVNLKTYGMTRIEKIFSQWLSYMEKKVIVFRGYGIAPKRGVFLIST